MTAKISVSNLQPLDMVCNIELYLASIKAAQFSGVTLPSKSPVELHPKVVMPSAAGTYPVHLFVSGKEIGIVAEDVVIIAPAIKITKIAWDGLQVYQNSVLHFSPSSVHNLSVTFHNPTVAGFDYRVWVDWLGVGVFEGPYVGPYSGGQFPTFWWSLLRTVDFHLNGNETKTVSIPSFTIPSNTPNTYCVSISITSGVDKYGNAIYVSGVAIIYNWIKVP